MPSGRVHPFRIRVSDLVGRSRSQRAGSQRAVHLSGLLEIRLDQVEECGPASADLRIEGIAGGVLVRGGVKASMRLRCNRCLSEVLFEAAAPVLQAYGKELKEQAEGDVLPVSPDGEIDLAGVLRDELCLSVPLAPLCSEVCRGLCPTCGSDLNVDACGGHSEADSSPFAALEGWLESPKTGG